MYTSTSGLPPENPAYLSNQDDEIRWGKSCSGDVLAGGRDDYADRAGLPRLPVSYDGLEHLATAQDAAKRKWYPPSPTHGHGAVSEFDPAKPGTPAPGFRQTIAPVSDPRVAVMRSPAQTFGQARMVRK